MEDWKIVDETFYPVKGELNLCSVYTYAALTEKDEKVVFGGSPVNYRYYDYGSDGCSSTGEEQGIDCLNP